MVSIRDLPPNLIKTAMNMKPVQGSKKDDPKLSGKKTEKKDVQIPEKEMDDEEKLKAQAGDPQLEDTESEINEKSPPDSEIEKWILSNKKQFKKQYGDKRGEEILYAKAWDMYNSKNESVSASPEPNSAVGRRLHPEKPKHVDIIKDMAHVAGEKIECIRALISYSNGRAEFFPPVDQKGAKSLEELDVLADTLDVEVAKDVKTAIQDAQDKPYKRPEHQGN